jgi:hypothetical protein
MFACERRRGKEKKMTRMKMVRMMLMGGIYRGETVEDAWDEGFDKTVGEEVQPGHVSAVAEVDLGDEGPEAPLRQLPALG